VAALTARYLDVLGAEIRRRPEQWLWLHRRWRLD
jgi:lauroyl/myristoyl acyltransferase